MAVSRTGNVIYADSTGTLEGQFQLLKIILTSSTGSGACSLQDGTNTILHVHTGSTNSTYVIDLANTPIRTETSVNISALANAVVTIIVKPIGG